MGNTVRKDGGDDVPAGSQSGDDDPLGANGGT